MKSHWAEALLGAVVLLQQWTMYNTRQERDEWKSFVVSKARIGSEIHYKDRVLITGGFYAGRTGVIKSERGVDDEYWLHLGRGWLAHGEYCNIKREFLQVIPE